MSLSKMSEDLQEHVIDSENKNNVPSPDNALPKMKYRDFTIEELRKYDGTGEEGRVLVAVNGKVFDATRGKRFYGPGGPYAAFAGRDASRGLATFSMTEVKETDVDLSDLSQMEMDSLLEWETQFTDKYDYVGRLLKPGEISHAYTAERQESLIAKPDD